MQFDLNGQKVVGTRFNDPDGIVLVIPQSERCKMRNEYADYHRLNGQLMAVTELRSLPDRSLMMLGKFVDEPRPYFLDDML